jgi:hypothetical protein
MKTTYKHFRITYKKTENKKENVKT